jgi:3-deoxy-manno-octulosonate cytidylyltransferase (CMP-KDO synthetase)
MISKDLAIVIPARIGSKRLKGKVLKKIGTKSMIYHVVQKALEADVGEVFVATDSQDVADEAESAGAVPVMTGEAESGTDRVFEAISKMDHAKNFKFIINLQGDLPLINSEIISEMASILKHSDADIVTLASKEQAEKENNYSRVKVVLSKSMDALYFSRNMIPCNQDWYWHHIGIYGFNREALEIFVELPQSPLEIQEKLEQLRALENGMKIKVSIVDEKVKSVDTEEDLTLVRNLYEKKHQIV